MIFVFSILTDAFFIALMAQCAATDIKTHTVSNGSVITLLCLGLVHMAMMLQPGGAWWIYPAGLLSAVPFFIAWLLGGMGAGDVKLLMGIGFYLGLWNMLAAFAFMLPALIVCTLITRKKGKRSNSTVPFAPVLACGAVGTVLLGYVLSLLN